MSRNKYILKLLFCICITLAGMQVYSQEAPPKPVSIYVSPSDGLVFGGFYVGAAGGTVTISPDGARSVTGDVGDVSLGMPFSPAIFQVEAAPGTIVSIMYGAPVILYGSNGGSMVLEIDDTSPGSPIITTVLPPERTQINVGGTLTVGGAAANPPGVYSGTFTITFIQE